jgi:hypothetical protein
MVDFIGCEVSSGMRTPEPDGVVADGPPVLPERDTHRTRQVAPPPADDHPADGDLHPADGPEIMSERDTISKMPRATTARGDFASGAAVWSCPGLATAVLAFLAPTELARCRGVSTTLHHHASDDTMWNRHCREAWWDKAFVPPTAWILLAVGKSHQAYAFAQRDARRTTITGEELTATTWFTRTRMTAGAHHMRRDPWRQGRPAVRNRFSLAGELTRVGTGGASMHSGSWTFICPKTNACNLQSGSVVQATRRGSDVPMPTKTVSRRRHDWAWVMTNCWSISTSVAPVPFDGQTDSDDQLDAQEISQALRMNRALRAVPISKRLAGVNFVAQLDQL